VRPTRRFAPEEDEFIRASRPDESWAAIAASLGRSSASVISRAATLGLHEPNRQVRRFTPEEDELIRASAGHRSLYELAPELGRPVSSLYGRARRLGLDFDPALRPANRRLKDGYWWVPVLDDGRRVWRQEHRLVVERGLGRQLRPREQVHHVNLDKTDNSVENLVVCASRAEHIALHNQLGSELARPWLVRELLDRDLLQFDSATATYRLMAPAD